MNAWEKQFFPALKLHIQSTITLSGVSSGAAVFLLTLMYPTETHHLVITHYTLSAQDRRRAFQRIDQPYGPAVLALWESRITG